MEIKCNTHAASFVKGTKPSAYDDVAALKHKLMLEGEYTFDYDYPLSNKASFKHTITPDMTGEDLLVIARADYERIYREEEGDDGDPGHIPGMFNRARSCGRYGIWGHDFSDLYFEGISINTITKQVELNMGS